MAILRIYTFPDQVLKKKAAPIERVDKSIFELADNMLETMYHAPGIGLAANQIGVLQRILVIDTQYTESGAEGFSSKEEHGDVEALDDKIISGKKPIIIVNPKIIHQEGTQVFCEGCLSVPDYQEEVTRAEKIKLEYQNIDGLTKTLSAEGLEAVCLQHELDHLNGKLFIDRLSALKRQIVKRKLIRLRQEREQDRDGTNEQ